MGASPETKVLYFDIDGTFLNYDDSPKTALCNGELETTLKNAKIDYLACVSGWVDIFAEEVMNLHSVDHQKEAIYKLLEPLFPDKNWFMDRLVLISDTDHRCSYIDLKLDWFYVDDWADTFFIAAQGEDTYELEKGNRILLCDHEGDGKDILDWLRSKVTKH